MTVQPPLPVGWVGMVAPPTPAPEWTHTIWGGRTTGDGNIYIYIYTHIGRCYLLFSIT